ncbi:MAG: Exonuclease SbcC, partial [Labilithrix sp.]|nr:Exonuclease SbcC [Labilithrix sp.]
GDLAAATDALLQAANDDPSAARWAAVEDAADRSGREHLRVEALQNLVPLVDDAARLDVQKRLARAEGARGSLAAAEDAWRAVLSVDPADGEADVAIEALLVARASYDDLAEHLARRALRLAEAGTEKDTLRAIRLRRAAILEQRLGRHDEAARELEQLLRETPGHVSAQRWLVDLYEKGGAPARALPLLRELAAQASDPAEQEALGARQVRVLLHAGDLPGARLALVPLLDRPAVSSAIAEARVAIGRASQDPVELGAALEALARSSQDDPRIRSELLVEAAQAAARAGDTDLSLARAKDAARLAPEVPSTQLFARGLEYRMRGPGNREDALVTVTSLAPLMRGRGLEPEDLALCAFLVAEAEDVGEPGSGEATLRACHAAIGTQALVSLGIAERAAAAGRHDEAVRFFVDAVYGNLLGLRRPGRVALAAADAAENLGDGDSVLQFLNEAAKDPETRVEALRRLAQVSFVSRDMTRARTVLRGLADALDGNEKAEVLAQLARALFDSKVPSERIEADRTLREAIAAAPPELATMLQEQLGGFRSRPPASELPRSVSSMPPIRQVSPLPTPPPGWPAPMQQVNPTAAAPGAPAPLAVIGHLPAAPPSSDASPPATVPDARPSSASPSQPLSDVPATPVVQVPELVERTRTDPPPQPAGGVTAVSAFSPLDRHAPLLTEARLKLAAGDREEGERLLASALREGSLAAADALDELLAGDASRSAMLLKVRRQAVELRPGDMKRLAALREAAVIDKNLNYVRAIDHVLRAFDPKQVAAAPPPLSAQSTQPGMLALLTRHSREVAGEALGIVWEGANALFAKPATAYRMTGVERVAPGPMSTLSRLYEVALRLLDTPRFALYHRRAQGPLTLTVALLQSPSAILAGDAKDDSPDVRWMLGHALASVIEQNALAVGLPEAEGRLLWDVLLGSFGPPGRIKMERAHANLADMLWQALAPRAQRRLKELLGGDDETPFDLVLERANQSGRRVGMYLTGDFAHAARLVVGEHPALDASLLDRPGGLAHLCAELPSLADLYRLAVRPEYADARWHVPSPQSQRFPFSASGTAPV